MPRSPIPVSLPIDLRAGEGSTSRRVAKEIVRLIADGRVREGEALPSTRTLAAELGVSRSATVAAYDELAASGYLRAVPGSMTTVETGAALRSRSFVGRTARRSDLASEPCVAPGPPELAYHLEPGYSDVELISRRAWSSAWRVARDDSLRPDQDAAPHPLDAEDAAGHAALRAELVGHLRRTRNIVCSPDDIFLFPQVTTAVTTLVRALDLSSRTVAFEDPGHLDVRNGFVESGCPVRAIDVGDDGISVDRLDDSDAIVYTTPEHQIPLGGRMPLHRRAELLDRVRRTDGLVIETDYDGCFRYDTAPLPAIRGLDGADEHVIFLGTSSAALHKGLRVTWAVVPRRFHGPLRRYLELGGDTVCTLASRAVAEFIERGSMLRHLASTSRVYSSRQDHFVEACRTTLPDVAVRREQTGLHVVLIVDPAVDDRKVATDLLDAGLACWPLRSFYAPGSSGPRRPGLLCGFARLPEARAADAASLIGTALREHQASR